MLQAKLGYWAAINQTRKARFLSTIIDSALVSEHFRDFYRIESTVFGIYRIAFQKVLQISSNFVIFVDTLWLSSRGRRSIFALKAQDFNRELNLVRKSKFKLILTPSSLGESIHAFGLFLFKAMFYNGD